MDQEIEGDGRVDGVDGVGGVGVGGFVERPDASRVTVSGPDARDFLQRMITADVSALSVGQCAPSFLLARSGRIVDRVVVMDRGDGFLLVGNDGREDATVEWLEKYVIADDVQVSRGGEDTALFTLIGPDALAAGAAWMDASSTGDAGRGATLVDAENFAGGSAHLVVPAAERGSALAALKPCPALALAAYATLCLVHGIPRFDREYGERTIPLETGMWDAISFTKGCYLGQEVVARLHHQKRVKRALVHLSFEGTVAPDSGTAVFAGEREVGEVTEATVWSGSVVAFAYVAADSVQVLDDGSVLAIEPLRVLQEPAHITAFAPGGQS